MDHEEILSRIELAQPPHPAGRYGPSEAVKKCDGSPMHCDPLKGSPLHWAWAPRLTFSQGPWFYECPSGCKGPVSNGLIASAQEPQRLARRYIADALGLARHLPAQVAANAIQPRKYSHAAIQAERFATSSVIAVSGDLNPSTLTDLEEHLGRAQHEDYDIILDLSETA